MIDNDWSFLEASLKVLKMAKLLLLLILRGGHIRRFMSSPSHIFTILCLTIIMIHHISLSKRESCIHWMEYSKDLEDCYGLKVYLEQYFPSQMEDMYALINPIEYYVGKWQCEHFVVGFN
jgi:hypothetical protein